MVFRRLSRSRGLDGPSVRTVLADPNCRPGDHLAGRVQLVGGAHPVDVAHLAVAWMTRVEVTTGDSGYDTDQAFHRQRVASGFRLAAGERRDFPFQVEVPWQTPITNLYGQPLPGITIGLRTELAVDREVDQCDLEPVAVYPLPAQERILATLTGLGFRLLRTGVERGRLYGARQTLPLRQEFEFQPSPEYRSTLNQLVLAFVAAPERMELLVELDKPGGVLARGRDTFGRFTVDYAMVDRTDWTVQLAGWLRAASRR